MSITFAEFAKTWNPFDEFRVVLKVATIAGGVPKHKDLIGGWIDATNKEKSEEDRQKLKDATLEALPDVTEEKAARSWVGFKSDEQGLYIEGRQLKSMMKESANIVKKIAPTRVTTKTPKGIGVTNFKSKMADHVFIVEDKVYLDRAKPDEQIERPIHVITPQGPRSSLKRTDVCHDVTLTFTLRRLQDDTAFSIKALFAALKYSENIGIGADRSQGMGKFEVVSCEQTTEPAPDEDDE